LESEWLITYFDLVRNVLNERIIDKLFNSKAAMNITFGDNVRIKTTPVTQQLELAGLIGQIYGETKPSISGAVVTGPCTDDYALNIVIKDRPDSIWLAPEFVELFDHAPGTEISIGNKRFVRSESGEWIEK
jgi:hypothetical protein